MGGWLCSSAEEGKNAACVGGGETKACVAYTGSAPPALGELLFGQLLGSLFGGLMTAHNYYY